VRHADSLAILLMHKRVINSYYNVKSSHVWELT